jgi:hypothetical protein
MERKVHIGNKWWKIRIIYSKEMKTIRSRVEDAMKRKTGRGLQRENRRKRRSKGGMGKENPKTRWKMQRGRD